MPRLLLGVKRGSLDDDSSAIDDVNTLQVIESLCLVTNQLSINGININRLAFFQLLDASNDIEGNDSGSRLSAIRIDCGNGKVVRAFTQLVCSYGVGCNLTLYSCNQLLINVNVVLDGLGRSLGERNVVET